MPTGDPKNLRNKINHLNLTMKILRFRKKHDWSSYPQGIAAGAHQN